MNNKENGGTVYVDRHGDDDFKDVAILVHFMIYAFFIIWTFMVDIVDYFDMMLMMNLQLMMMIMNNLLFLIVKMIVVKGMGLF